MSPDEHDPLHPHAHEPNPEPPSEDTTFVLVRTDGEKRQFSLNDLKHLPVTTISNCYIISTGHGTSGPFTFSGVPLAHFIAVFEPNAWSQVEIISADGFGNRVFAEEVTEDSAFLLAYMINGQPMTRQQGCVRLIVPGERDDALRQVKWIGEVRIRP
ncbi:MAG: molybdopterin-dependent oxidoreductase [Anaerolineales bacterium]|nr:molybdopterin-dependent oxidoreductase [Anaerolineales bacterium]